MSGAPRKKLASEEYLVIERAAESKSILYRGEMYAMTDARRAHILITGNLFASIHGQFVDRTCEVYASDMRAKNNRTNSYFYPDVAAVCHDPKFEDGQLDTLTNSQVVIEVLSESTEHFERASKFEDYQLLDSLQEYVLVSQDKIRVEAFRKLDDGSWNYVSLCDSADVLNLDSVDAQVPLSEIYAKVEFDEGDVKGLKVIEEKPSFSIPR